MVARLCPLVLVLAAGPRASAGPAPAVGRTPDPLAEAERVFNERGQQAAAEYAAAESGRADRPRAQRLELALFASNVYATLYQIFPDDPPGDPIYLCHALAMLDASGDLAVTPEDRERHQAHRDIRQATLEQNHPDYRCPEVRAETTAPLDGGLMPVPTSPRTVPLARPVPNARRPTEARPVQPSPSTLRLRRRALAWTAIGGVTFGLGVASLAAMGGLLVSRENSRRRAEDHDTEITPEQRRDAEDEHEAFARAGNLAIAAGVAGSVMAITGLASVIRGTVLRGRLRLVPDVGADRAALVLTGRF
jgi:hypothetical protein